MADSRWKLLFGKKGKSDSSNPFGASTEQQWQSAFTGASGSRQRGSLPFSIVVLGFVVLAAAAIVALYMNRPKVDSNKPDDLGQGVVNAAGLRGHLVARWDGKAQYKLKIEPLDARDNEGFAFVAANPPQPFSVNIRLLDSSGFALCEKEILFPFHAMKTTAAVPPAGGSKKKPADIAAEQAEHNAELQSLQEQEKQRERGKDVFRNILGDDGKVVAVYTEGTLPCTMQLYRRIYYWDLSSNFPTIAQQEILMKAPEIAAEKRLAAARAAARRKKFQIQPLSFFAEGDETVTGFDASKGVLEAGRSKGFIISNKGAEAIAAAWAANGALIHYKCNQHALCTLSSAGGGAAILAKLSE